MRWGIAVRDAWNGVFESETVLGCLCADDSNPYSRLPLILAANRGIPTLVCHHGAMDSKMAVKVAHADTYLAKGEIEQDFLVRSCGVAPEKVVLGGQGLGIRAGDGEARGAIDRTLAGVFYGTVSGGRMADRRGVPRSVAEIVVTGAELRIETGFQASSL